MQTEKNSATQMSRLCPRVQSGFRGTGSASHRLLHMCEEVRTETSEQLDNWQKVDDGRMVGWMIVVGWMDYG